MRKANIFCNNDQKYRNDYVNIDISNNSNRNDVVKLLPNEFDIFFESEEFDSIVVNDCINFFDELNQISFIRILATKLSRNGHIYISFHDIEEIARKLLNSKINMGELNAILYKENGSTKLSVSTLASVTNILVNSGFIITGVNFSDTLCSIEGLKK